MCCSPKSYTNNRNTKKRVIAFAFLICFIAASLLSQAFILSQAEHEHDHNGTNGSCTTCAQIQSAEDLLKQLGTAVVSAASASACLFAVISIIRYASSDITFLTPVTLKIRMNN